MLEPCKIDVCWNPRLTICLLLGMQALSSAGADALVTKETACRAAELEAVIQAKHKELEGVLAEARTWQAQIGCTWRVGFHSLLMLLSRLILVTSVALVAEVFHVLINASSRFNSACCFRL